MKFTLSNNIAFETSNRKKAEEFYENVLGMVPTNREVAFTEFANENVKFYVGDRNKTQGLMLDFEVEDQEKAVNYLKSKGCEVLYWNGIGSDCFIKDPFGLVFNIFENQKI